MAKQVKNQKPSVEIPAIDASAEVAQPSTALAVTTPTLRPSSAMQALFAARPAAIMESMKRRNLPQLIKAVDGDKENIPVGGRVTGIVVDVVKSPVSTIKGSLLWLHLVTESTDGNGEIVLAKTGIEICFPATGVIRSALAPGIEGEVNALKEMAKYKGFLFAAQRLENKVNKTYGKEMTMWDVRLSDKEMALALGVKTN